MYTSVHGGVQPVTFYPVIELHLTYHADGSVKEWTVPECCFHDLFSATTEELAGMGLALIGNLVKLLGQHLYDDALDAQLLFKRDPKDVGIPMPWPGMPSDDPRIPLDLTQFPFDVGMFEKPTAHSSVLTPETEMANKRLSRWQLMARIQQTWVPHLQSLMATAHA